MLQTTSTTSSRGSTPFVTPKPTSFATAAHSNATTTRLPHSPPTSFTSVPTLLAESAGSPSPSPLPPFIATLSRHKPHCPLLSSMLFPPRRSTSIQASSSTVLRQSQRWSARRSRPRRWSSRQRRASSVPRRTASRRARLRSTESSTTTRRRCGSPTPRRTGA